MRQKPWIKSKGSRKRMMTLALEEEREAKENGEFVNYNLSAFTSDREEGGGHEDS